MTDNVGVKALLSWVNSTELYQQELQVNDFQDGAALLKVVHLLKQEPVPSLTNSTEDCFEIVAHFLETECRFNVTKGTPLSLKSIKDGVNLTVEVAKVLLLLAYHDVMNDRLTLNRLDCDVETEIAKLTGSFVMENEGYVYLASGLVDYLESKESPVIYHKRKQISFVEIETVASSSTSTSPLQNIMNTPKFQLRKLQRQVIKERDYTEGLENELSTKIADIAQKERHINQLRWCLDKLKKEQTDGEHAAREQITELEIKSDMLQMRLNEILKKNKEISSTSLLMEHKINELTEENGVLSLQMRTVNPKLETLEAEIGRLTENHTCAEKMWKEKTSSLESKLIEVAAQKESLAEHVEILQGKISQLENELSFSSKEEVGENMGHIMEKENFETEVRTLKNKLERALCSLNEAEICVQAKTQQLAECQEEMTHQKNLLGQQDHETKCLMQEKDEMLDRIQQEFTGQRVFLQQEIENLKFQLQQAEQQKCEQISRLQQQIVVQEQEVEKLRQTVQEKEDLISLTEENIKDLNTKLSVLSSIMIDKDKQMNSLGEEIEVLKEESKQNKDELQEKDKMLTTLTREKCNEKQLFESQIKSFTIQVENLTMSLKQAEQETQNRQDLLVETQKLNVQQQEVLQQDIAAREKCIQMLKEEIHIKNEQLAILRSDCSCQVELLEEEITVLKGQLEHLNSDFKKVEQQLQNENLKFEKQEKESNDQIQLLQQRLTASEDEVRATKEEMFKQEDVITTLNMQSLECSRKFNEEIDNLQNRIQCLQSSLRNAEENLQSKENLFAEKTLQASRDMEVLQIQMATSRQEAEVLNAEICEKEKQILVLKTENAFHSELAQREIETLNQQMQANESLEEEITVLKGQLEHLNSDLKKAEQQLQNENLKFEKQEKESNDQIQFLQQRLTASEDEVRATKEEMFKQEDVITTLNMQSLECSRKFNEEINNLQNRIQCLQSSFRNAEENLQSKENLFAEKTLQASRDMEVLQIQMATSRQEAEVLNAEICEKEKQILVLKTENAFHSELAQREIETLNQQMQANESLEEEITVLKGQLEHLNSDLKKAEQQLQNENLKFERQEKESNDQIQLLQQRLTASEDEVRATKEEMFKQEDVITTLNMQSLECSRKFNEEIDNLQNRIQCLQSSLRNAEENLQPKENLFAEKALQASRDTEVLQIQMATSRQEAEVLNAKICEKEKQILVLKTENAFHSELAQREIETLNQQMQAISNSLDLTQKKLQTREDMVAKLKQDNNFQKELLQQQLLAIEEEVERLKKDNHSKEKQIMQLCTASSTQIDLLHQTKEQEILQIRKDNTEQMYRLQQQLASANAEKQGAHELQLATHKEKEELMFKIDQAEKDRRSLEKQLEALFIQAKESAEKISESEERYKAQVEMTVNYNNVKKEMERQIEAAITENKILQLDLDKAQTNEKKLNSIVASLEAQLAFADQKLRAQNETVGNGKRSQSLNSDGPSTSFGAHSKVQKKRAISSDSLEQSSLEDSLNNTRHLCTPDKSSTPRGCSPKPLARRPSFCAESPETSSSLTPTSTRNGKENKVEFDSGWKTPASSVKRRRTTQVISITMAKKTPGNCEDEDTFGSLASAASHPNLSDGAFVRPVPMEPFDTPAKKLPLAGDQLIGLPGYRRSAVYPNSTSTFCVGAENEPDGASEDWMRIAELQARNKTCLPHLKSSYPVEFDTGGGSAFIFTDEELRTGDPSDTIRRASMMPGQLKDSLTSHRLSLMMPNSGTTASTHSQRLSLMPGLLPAKNISLTQRRSTKDTKKSTSMASVLQTSPEKKMKASCFPRPLTPKNKNMLNGTSSSVLHPTLSPAERRQSMMFTIDNTPKNQSYLKKGLNKLRRSTRKSPCKSFKSPAQMLKNRGQENMPTMNVRTAVARAGRSGNSPRLATKNQKNIRSSNYKQDSKVANAEG